MGNVRLKEAYPALYKLAIPLNTTATISGEVSPYRTLVWKCPNGPDHEWSMRVVDMIKRFDRPLLQWRKDFGNELHRIELPITG